MNTFIEDLSALLSTAHLACSLSKKSGGNHLHIYRQHDDEFARYREELSLLPYISEALSENRFCLYSQAIQHISSRKHRISHFEILIRMIDKNREIIPPERFIPTAENFNVMPEIDRWVLTHLLPLLHEKLKAGKINRQTIFAINLSGSSLNHEAFLRFLLEYVKEFKFPKNFLCFEITETAALSHFARVVSFIDELHEKGIMLALDDFGSGWTSFNYLKSLPVDFLKIDGLFVKEIAHNKMDRALVETINHIGHIMGLTTIAEYVETAEIMKHIEQIGVDYAQGFYISKPRPLHL